MSEWNGYPPDSTKSGWHIFRCLRHAPECLICAEWVEGMGIWVARGESITPTDFDRTTWEYVGPVTLPGQIDPASFAKGAEAMREATAKICDEVDVYWQTEADSALKRGMKGRDDVTHCFMAKTGAVQAATRIRALPLPTPEQR